MWSFIGILGLVIFHPIVLIITPAMVIGFYLLRWGIRVLLVSPPGSSSKAAVSFARSVGFTPRMPGVDYERAVAQSLKASGWETKTTKGSGDHGLDVMAISGSRSVAIQCKMYSKPVGNRAIQEAYAAKDIHHATHAVVVASNGFTRAAHEAANKLGVILIHHDDLHNLGSSLTRIEPRLVSSPNRSASIPLTAPKSELRSKEFRPRVTVEKAVPDLRALAAEQRKKIEASRDAY